MEQPTEFEFLPDKTYFKIGEVCKLTGLKSHTLRYWESQFTVIKPQRVGSQQRLYRRIDVENILTIKKLIHEEGLTLSGTKKYLARKRKESKEGAETKPDLNLLKNIKTELVAIKKILD